MTMPGKQGRGDNKFPYSIHFIIIILSLSYIAFYEGIPGAITTHEDSSLGMKRVEIVCTACGGHLGHVFKGEGYDTPTDERHCVNSVSLKFQK